MSFTCHRIRSGPRLFLDLRGSTGQGSYGPCMRSTGSVLRLVLQNLEEHKLYAKPSNCTIGVSELEFRGYIVGNGRCRPTAAKVQLLKENEDRP